MRLYIYLVVIVGLMLLLNMANINQSEGYVLGTGNASLSLDNPNDIQNTEFGGQIVALLLSAAVIGIVVGFITKSPAESVLTATYGTILVKFVIDVFWVMNYLRSPQNDFPAYYGIIAMLILFPLGIGYLHSIVSWWAGRGD